jgi:multisubunit Na+/H+ antiporter MnhE subunit
VTGWLGPRSLAAIAALTALWCGLWNDLSLGTAVVGLLLGVAVTALVGPARGATIRWRPLVRLLGIVLVDLVKSTVAVAVEIVTPTDRTDEAVIAVPVPVSSREHLLLLAIAITVTPGTAVVDADPHTGTLYLHLLHHRRRAETEAHVQALARLACAALPTDERALT